MSDSCPNGAECDNPGRRPGIHATHRPNPQTGAHPYPPSLSRMHAVRPCRGRIRTVRVPDAYAPFPPQGRTLGWCALTLWVEWNAAERQSPTGRRNFETAPQTRMNACDARYHEVRGRSQNVHPAYTTHSTNMRVRSPQMARLPTQLPTNVGGCVNRPPEARFGDSGGSEGLGFEVSARGVRRFVHPTLRLRQHPQPRESVVTDGPARPRLRHRLGEAKAEVASAFAPVCGCAPPCARIGIVVLPRPTAKHALEVG